MFGIGASELLVVFFVALLVLGPERLPQAARTLARLFGEFRKASDDLRIGLVGITDDVDLRRQHNNPNPPRVIEVDAGEPPKADPEAPVARTTEQKNG